MTDRQTERERERPRETEKRREEIWWKKDWLISEYNEGKCESQVETGRRQHFNNLKHFMAEAIKQK